MSAPAYPSLKSSGVEWLGDVPSHWSVYPGRRIFRQIREPSRNGDQQLSASQKYGIIPQALLMALEDQKVVLALKGLDGFKHVEADDFVISLRSFQGGIEHSAYGGCVSPAYTILRPTTVHFARFYYYTLKCAPYIAALQSITDGIRDGKNISFEQFGVVQLPTPPMEEQTAIAAFLDRETAKIDALVDEQRRLIALLKEKRQAVISHAVTKGLNPDAPMKDSGIEWLGEVPAHWDTIALCRLVDPLRPITYGIVQPGEPDPSGRFMVRGQDYSRGWALPEDIFRVSDAVEYPYRRARLAPGDVIVTIVGAGTGNTAVVPEFLDGANLTQTTARIAPSVDRVNGSYLSTVMGSRLGAVQVALFQKGAAQPGLNLEHLKAFRFPLPPIKEQGDIVRSLERSLVGLSDLVVQSEAAISLLQERRAALISAAVTGKIDVRGIVAPAAEMEAA